MSVVDDLSIADREQLADALDPETIARDREAAEADQAQAEVEDAEARNAAAAGLTSAITELEDRYTNLVDAIRCVNLAAEDVREFRAKEFTDARRAAEAAGIDPLPYVPRLSLRASRIDRSILKDLYALRAWAASDV
jgi:hypothetical protein